MATFKAPSLGPGGYLRDKHLPPNLRDGNLQGFLADEVADPASPLHGELSATFGPAFAPSTSIVYDGSGNVTSATENGITTTYTYNADGTVNTETRLGKVRTWAYDANGNPTSSTVV